MYICMYVCVCVCMYVVTVVLVTVVTTVICIDLDSVQREQGSALKVDACNITSGYYSIQIYLPRYYVTV